MTAVFAKKITEPETLPVSRILVCRGQGPKPDCGGEAVYKNLIAESQRLNIPVAIEPAKCGCSERCQEGPYLSLPDLHLFYYQVQEAHIPYILTETVQKGKILFPLLYINPLQAIRGDLVWEKTPGCIMTMDTTTCMVQVARYLITFHYDESCGKCVPCRLGIQKLADLIEDVSKGRAPENAVSEMESLISLMQQAPYCAFAGKVSHIILAVLSHFKEEFEIHIKEKRCPVGACAMS
jgi:(2Fe-2S) ferredoxin